MTRLARNWDRWTPDIFRFPNYCLAPSRLKITHPAPPDPSAEAVLPHHYRRPEPYNLTLALNSPQPNNRLRCPPITRGTTKRAPHTLEALLFHFSSPVLPLGHSLFTCALRPATPNPFAIPSSPPIPPSLLQPPVGHCDGWFDLPATLRPLRLGPLSARSSSYRRIRDAARKYAAKWCSQVAHSNLAASGRRLILVCLPPQLRYTSSSAARRSTSPLLRSPRTIIAHQLAQR